MKLSIKSKLGSNDIISATDAPNSFTSLVLGKKIHSFERLCGYVQALPYSRISDRQNLKLVLIEKTGTCSTKHGFVKSVAIEQNLECIKLFLIIFKMNRKNTPGIGRVLEDNGLSYIPEAHCLLDFNGSDVDLTGLSDSTLADEDVLIRQEIMPSQVGTWKVDFHRNYLKDWAISNKIELAVDELWKIREQCILSLTKN